jgi:L-rhamnose mutarotase
MRGGVLGGQLFLLSTTGEKSPVFFNGTERCADLEFVYPMIRKAFVMSVHAGVEAEYRRRHSPIWPELEAVLKSHGVGNYSIFLHPETRQLFGYAEIEDEAQWAAIAQSEVCRRWWAHMRELMPSNADNSPVATALDEVFHLD